MNIDWKYNTQPNQNMTMMSIILNFNGLSNSVRELLDSTDTDISSTLALDKFRQNRVFITPSRFKIQENIKSFDRSVELCSGTRKAISNYLGKNRLNKLNELIGSDILQILITEYIAHLRKDKYDVGSGDFLLRETLKENIQEVINASEIQLIEEKYI